MTSSSAYRMPKWLRLIAVMTAIGPVSIDLYVPGFTAIAADLHERGVERTMASYLLGLAIGQLIYGPVSDRFGRKPPLYAGFIIYTLGAVGCALSTSMTMLIVCRVLQALGGCSAITIGRAIVRDRCEPQDAARAFTMLMTIVSVAPILAPVAGGWIVTAFGWRATFWIQGALGLALLIAVHFMLTESLDPAHARPLGPVVMFRTCVRLLRDRAFLGYTLVSSCIMSALFSYVSAAPTVLTRVYGLSPQNFGLLTGLNGVAFLVASRLNLRALHRSEPHKILARYIWGPVIFGAALVALDFAISPPFALVIALQFGFFVCSGRVTPNISALALAQHGRDAGSASAVMGTLQSLGPAVAGTILSHFNDGTLRPLFMAPWICALLAIAAFAYATSAQRGVAKT